MPNDPLLARIRSRTPLHTKVAVSKIFDLAEEVSAALERTGHSPGWLAEKAGISLDELTGWLSGMHPLYDSIARLEAALEMDLMVTPGRPDGYFHATAHAPHGKVIPMPLDGSLERPVSERLKYIA